MKITKQNKTKQSRGKFRRQTKNVTREDMSTATHMKSKDQNGISTFI